MLQHPKIVKATRLFQENFRSAVDLQANGPRRVGLENEYLMVASDGSIMRPEVLDALWSALAEQGWRLGTDAATGCISSATRPRLSTQQQRTHDYDVITTDFGYATLEIDLAPAQSLHEAGAVLRELIALVMTILSPHDVYLLGYGVQPVTKPDIAYLGPKGRYKLIVDVREAENELNPGPFTVDLHCMNAACQTQVEVAPEEAIPVVNAFNATSGLRIALLANSPVWQNTISEHSALRQLFWDWCWPNRQSEFGMPPLFASIEHYVNYLLDFRTIAVRRGETFYRLSGTTSLRQLLIDDQGQIGITYAGQTERIVGEAEDIWTQYAFAWFDSRLQPHHGTIEDRVSCQQPPRDHFCASALTLGLVENHHSLVELADTLSRDQWRDIRLLACTHGMNFSYPGVDVKALLYQLLRIAFEGLNMRGLKEEVYLEPLYQRVGAGYCPADNVREQFAMGGVKELIRNHDMRHLLTGNLVTVKSDR